MIQPTSVRGSRARPQPMVRSPNDRCLRLSPHHRPSVTMAAVGGVDSSTEEAVPGAVGRDVSRATSTSSPSTIGDNQGQGLRRRKVRRGPQSSKSAPLSLIAPRAAYSHEPSGPWQVPPTAPASRPTASARWAACPGSLPSTSCRRLRHHHRPRRRLSRASDGGTPQLPKIEPSHSHSHFS